MAVRDSWSASETACGAGRSRCLAYAPLKAELPVGEQAGLFWSAFCSHVISTRCSLGGISAEDDVAYGSGGD